MIAISSRIIARNQVWEECGRRWKEELRIYKPSMWWGAGFSKGSSVVRQHDGDNRVERWIVGWIPIGSVCRSNCSSNCSSSRKCVLHTQS